MGGVEISYLPYLASGKNPNFAFGDIYHLRHQGSFANDENNPEPKNIPDEIPQL